MSTGRRNGATDYKAKFDEVLDDVRKMPPVRTGDLKNAFTSGKDFTRSQPQFHIPKGK
jgi:hypothetical protein